jgi:predicted short-subunit dehydrogenase-like oxidoreductase (DUF2520 family)
MRQVPTYLFISNGRVSRHFQYYFQQSSISFETWDRSQSEKILQQKISHASHVLALIKDDAIESFIKTHCTNPEIHWIHFSGSLALDNGIGTHPLMSFSHNLYSLEQYQQIPFVIDHDAPAFDVLFPQLSNPHVRLNKKLKPLYHALCVLGGNFSCMLWQKLFSDFENKLQIPASIAHGYFKKQMDNLMQNYQAALTGPLVRNDVKTMQNNLNALHEDPFQQIYENFILCYQKIKEENGL